METEDRMENPDRVENIMYKLRQRVRVKLDTNTDGRKEVMLCSVNTVTNETLTDIERS